MLKKYVISKLSKICNFEVIKNNNPDIMSRSHRCQRNPQSVRTKVTFGKRTRYTRIIQRTITRKAIRQKHHLASTILDCKNKIHENC